MSFLKKISALAASGVALVALSTPASAAPVYCTAESERRNYMMIDDSDVSGCLLSGAGNGQAGNIGQAAANDPFLNSSAGAGWTNISGGAGLSFTQSGHTGTWSFNSAAWSLYTDLAIGFKFGTGNHPDEWFVFSVADLVSSGDWTFFNVGGTGGGLSHLVLYASGGRNSVPEPGTLGLLGLGLAGLAASIRRRRKAA